MTKTVHWLVELSINEGMLDEMKAVMSDMIAGAKEEGGTLVYEWCFNEDETEVSVYERYADSDAVMTHMNNFGSKGFAPRFGPCVTRKKMTVLGHPNDEAKQILDSMSAVYMTTQAGFSKVD